jgi:putative flippase GtrA
MKKKEKNCKVGYLDYEFDVKIWGEGVRFTIVGAIALFLSVLSVYVFTEFFGLHYMNSAMLSYVFVPVFTFVMDKTWAFKEKLFDGFWKSFAVFYLIIPIVLFTNLVLLYIFTESFHIYYVISQVMAVFLSGCLKFFLSRVFAFRANVEFLNE